MGFPLPTASQGTCGHGVRACQHSICMEVCRHGVQVPWGRWSGQDTSVEVGRHSVGEGISMEAGGLGVGCISTVSVLGCMDMVSWGLVGTVCDCAWGLPTPSLASRHAPVDTPSMCLGLWPLLSPMIKQRSQCSQT